MSAKTNLKSSLKRRFNLDEFSEELSTITSATIILLVRISKERNYGKLYIEFDYNKYGYSKQYYYKYLNVLKEKDFIKETKDGFYINQHKYPCINKREANKILKTFSPTTNGIK